VHAKATNLVGGCSDNTATRRTANDHGLALQTRVVEHLYGGKEGVHIDM
jgi:hypothetical protein